MRTPRPIVLAAARQIQDPDELREHFHLQRMTLLAHSYGPLLAASYALAHPHNVARIRCARPAENTGPSACCRAWPSPNARFHL
ncbi:MAG TPA: hypothetical protein VN706_16365 [Gemmatimonadaceae bacterium]|nr:hypothetical protein [Gemmatimonadaceae bacterium]